MDYIPFPFVALREGNNSLSTILDDAHRAAGDCQYLRTWEPTNETWWVPGVTEAVQVTSFECNRCAVDSGLRLRYFKRRRTDECWSEDLNGTSETVEEVNG